MRLQGLCILICLHWMPRNYKVLVWFLSYFFRQHWRIKYLKYWERNCEVRSSLSICWFFYCWLFFGGAFSFFCGREDTEVCHVVLNNCHFSQILNDRSLSGRDVALFKAVLLSFWNFAISYLKQREIHLGGKWNGFLRTMGIHLTSEVLAISSPRQDHAIQTFPTSLCISLEEYVKSLHWNLWLKMSTSLQPLQHPKYQLHLYFRF